MKHNSIHEFATSVAPIPCFYNRYQYYIGLKCQYRYYSFISLTMHSSGIYGYLQLSKVSGYIVYSIKSIYLFIYLFIY